MAQLQITDTIFLNEDEIEEKFVRSSGPGGQNANKVATAVQLRFNVRLSPSLPERVRSKILGSGDTRLTKDGELVLIAEHKVRLGGVVLKVVIFQLEHDLGAEPRAVFGVVALGDDQLGHGMVARLPVPLCSLVADFGYHYFRKFFDLERAGFSEFSSILFRVQNHKIHK